jgi:hypothetical protein
LASAPTDPTYSTPQSCGALAQITNGYNSAGNYTFCLGEDYRGDSLGNSTVATLDECMTLCISTPLCIAIHYNVDGGCFLRARMQVDNFVYPVWLDASCGALYIRGCGMCYSTRTTYRGAGCLDYSAAPTIYPTATPSGRSFVPDRNPGGRPT